MRPRASVTAEPPLALSDGATAQRIDGALELRDPNGRVVLRYRDGSLELLAPQGDVVFAAPNGRVTLRSAEDIAIEAGRDLVQSAARKLSLEASNEHSELGPAGTRVSATALSIEAAHARAAVGHGSVEAQELVTKAERIAYQVERFEVTAEQIVERARSAVRDVADLLHTRAGRVRTLVRDVYALRSRRTVMTSKDDTAIDGNRILLG